MFLHFFFSIPQMFQGCYQWKALFPLQMCLLLLLLLLFFVQFLTVNLTNSPFLSLYMYSLVTVHSFDLLCTLTMNFVESIRSFSLYNIYIHCYISMIMMMVINSVCSSTLFFSFTSWDENLFPFFSFVVITKQSVYLYTHTHTPPHVIH